MCLLYSQTDFLCIPIIIELQCTVNNTKRRPAACLECYLELRQHCPFADVANASLWDGKEELASLDSAQTFCLNLSRSRM